MSGASWEAVVKLRRESGQGASVSQSQAWHTEQSRPQQPHSGGRSPSEVALNVDETPGADTLSLETVFRTSISSQSDLPVAVSAAQSALLAQSRYSSGGGSDRRNTGPSSVGRVAAGVMAAAEATTDSSVPLKFSKDVVVVEVRGAPADLTLIDLPGNAHMMMPQLVPDITCSSAAYYSLPDGVACLLPLRFVGLLAARRYLLQCRFALLLTGACSSKLQAAASMD